MSETITLPQTGTWTIDPSHSSVEFIAKHLVVSKVRGRFGSFSGTIEVADPIEGSKVDVSLDAASIDTGDTDRDGHLQSGDFLDVERFPQLTFRSTGAHRRDDRTWSIPGELTIRGATKPVTLDVEYLGVFVDPWGNEKAAFTASTELDREEFGLTWNQALEAGGVLVGNKVKIEIDVQLAQA
ncbi:MAG: YceI family protein [Nitriliruptoraceae bacterium]